MPDAKTSGILISMGVMQKNTLTPFTARILAAIFLLAGILLGVFNVPQFFDSLLGKVGFPARYTLQATSFNIPYRLGLDIRGGAHLVYQADVSGIDSSEYSESLNAVRDVIERRVNMFGVQEPLVQVNRSGGDWRLIVELAGVKDIASAIRLIGETPFLEFREERDTEEQEKMLNAQKEGTVLLSDPYFKPTSLTGKHVKRAELLFDPTSGQPQVSLELTDDGGTVFADLTKRNVGKRLAIYLDGAPISAPVVQEEITGGKASISGNFTPEEAKTLVGRLNAGALPVPISLIAQQTVEASLGEESLTQSLNAGIYGLILVALFMAFWYRLPGILAIAALLLYIVLVLAIFKIIPVTLTVAGIVGFILSLGMAVDANILIFERMKEELRGGQHLGDAIHAGFRRAWSSIRDSNVSSLITAGVLYWFGTSIVQGFALTLSIGILASMFSAIVVTRTLLVALLTTRIQNLRFLFLSGINR